MERYTLKDFQREFADEDKALSHLVSIIYPDGISCRVCQRVRPHTRIKGRKGFACDSCGTHTYPMAGTIFAKSSTPLDSWFYAMYIMASTRCGISAKQLERELGVTYKTAWRMFTQIRKLMDEPGGPLQGEVEIDETLVGGHPRYAKGRRPLNAAGTPKKGKRPADHGTQQVTVLGAVERGGRVRARVAPDRKRSTLMPLVVEHVMPASTVYTDEWTGYDPLRGKGYHHKRIQHVAKVYVKGDTHTQTIEGFWSLLKNGIRGVHHSVGAGYLQAYVDSYTFRYNHRKDATPMFRTLTHRAAAVRHGRYGAYAPVGE